MFANKLASLEEILLMGPGPSCVPPEVYAALAKPTIGHMDGAFIAIMDDLKAMLQTVMNTRNRLTIPISGTGSSGMETCLVNLVEPGDPVLILINGVFGMRQRDLATRLGAQVDALEFEWGTPVRLDAVKKQLDRKHYKIVVLVHAETSTGVRNPAKEIGELLKGTNTLYLLDTVTSLGGIPVEMDAWGVDALFSGTQKCLSCPPGLSPLSFSDRALAAVQARKTKVPSWYFDLTMITQYWEGHKRVYHHTAPVNMVYGLYQAVKLIIDEGLDSVFARHQANHDRLVSGLEALGLTMLVEKEWRLPELNAILVPGGVDEAAARARLRSEFKIEIGAGLGPLAGKIWRIGLMGHTARPENVDRVLGALRKVLA